VNSHGDRFVIHQQQQTIAKALREVSEQAERRGWEQGIEDAANWLADNWREVKGFDPVFATRGIRALTAKEPHEQE